MTDHRISQFTPDAQRRIADAVRRVERSALRETGRWADVPDPFNRVIRWGRTTTNYDYPTYPSSGGTYVVEMGEYQPDTLVPGDTPDKTFTAYDPAWTEVAVDPTGSTIAQGTVVRVELHDGQWWIRPVPSPLLVDAIALATFCTDPENPTVACDTLIPYGDFDQDMFADQTVDAEIGYGLEGCEGDHLLLAWQPRSQYKWKVVQVDHRAQNVLQSAQYSDCSLIFKKKAIRAVNCCPGTTDESIAMYEHTYYSDVELLAEYTEGMTPESSTCELKLKGRVSTICGFEPQSSGSLTTLDTLSLTGAHVGGPVTDDGICLEQKSRWVWVLCATAESAAVDIICTEECGE